MVTLIVGPINSGKTTQMAALHREKGGDGVLCPKFMESGVHRGYDLVHLATGETLPFARFSDSLPKNWHEAFTFGPYSFSTRGQEKAAEIIEKAIEAGISPIFIDEIGPVELQGQGFAPLLRRLLQGEQDTIVSVRDFLLEQIINFFEIKKDQMYKEQI